MPESAPRPADEPRGGRVAAGARRSPVPDHAFLVDLGEAVNHHVRTALTPMLGHTELLLEQQQQQQLPEELHRSLVAVTRAGRRLNDVVHGICELIRIACVDPTAAETVDVAAMLVGELARCRIRAAQKQVRLVVGGDPVVPCVVDPARLRRAVAELLDNAVAFAPERSTVQVTTTARADGVRITVSDAGDGIDPADRERLLRPFEQGSGPRPSGTGQGLGLALAAAFAASRGGRLVLAERSGGGLHVSLEVPAEVARAAGAMPSPHG